MSYDNWKTTDPRDDGLPLDGEGWDTDQWGTTRCRSCGGIDTETTEERGDEEWVVCTTPDCDNEEVA